MSRGDGSVGGILSYLDVSAMSLVLLISIAVIAGAIEDQMAPFASVLYMVVQLFIFDASVRRGMIPGIFLATGFLTLVVMGSMFRPVDAQVAYRAELPVDVFLFYSLAILPGFFLMLYEQGLEEIRDEVAQEGAKIKALKSQAQEMTEKRRAASLADAGDERLDVRRGNSVAELVRNSIQARGRAEVTEILARAISNGAEAETVAFLRPDASGGLNVESVRAPGGGGGVLAGDHPVLTQLGDGSRPVVLSAPVEVVPGIEAGVLLPINAGGQVLGVVFVKHSGACDAEFEIKYLTTMHKMAQGLVTRFR